MTQQIAKFNCPWDTGPTNPILEDKEIHIWCASIWLPKKRTAHLQKLLSDDELKRANRFKFEHLHQRFIAGRGQLRVILSRYLDILPDKLRFKYGSQGKPTIILPAEQPAINFNLAHSGNMALYGVVLNDQIGIDVEKLRSVDEMAAIAGRFFSTAEYAEFQSVSAEKKERAFFNCWTRKESYIKATGAGLTQPLDEFDVSLTPGKAVKLVRVANNIHASKQWTLAEITPATGYVGALAVLGKSRQLRYWQL